MKTFGQSNGPLFPSGPSCVGINGGLSSILQIDTAVSESFSNPHYARRTCTQGQMLQCAL